MEFSVLQYGGFVKHIYNGVRGEEEVVVFTQGNYFVLEVKGP